MIADYDDDTHFCLKCHATILGLDNYVVHRKSGCAKAPEGVQDEALPSKADDFFSSLELQSSAKKATAEKSASGILTRSKTSAIIHGTNKEKDSTQPSGGKTWITQEIVNKKQDEREYEESESDSELDYEDSDEEDGRVPPRSFTGGKWKPSSPLPWGSREWHSPPPNHTKGKWKPASPILVKENQDVPPPSFTGSKWTQSKAISRTEYDIPPPTHTKGKWKPDSTRQDDEEDVYPPPEHTKGKWKPGSMPTKTEEFYSPVEAFPSTSKEASPPATYTKGKWKPPDKPIDKQSKMSAASESPLRKSSGTVQYWCEPCNRRLASKIVYERHLKSELHFKRTLHEREFDASDEILSSPKKRNRTSKKSLQDPEPMDKKKRARKKLFMKCEVCRSRVNCNLIGKHLISHYHCRKGTLSRPEAQQMVLDNIRDIILQSPFQCSACRFFCNTENEFLVHWRSQMHQDSTRGMFGLFLCTFCSFQCHNNDDMLNHLLSEEHKEVVAVINRSVPIVIRKVNPVKCLTCGEHFLLNIQLKQHCKETDHACPDGINNKYSCNNCNRYFKNSVALLKHQRKKHKASVYNCTTCSLNFSSAVEAKKHRSSKSHRYMLLAKKDQLFYRNTQSRKCRHCHEEFQNIPKLKQHLEECHPESRSSCPFCGKAFIVPQDLTVHIRTKACSFTDVSKNEGQSCDQCPFSSPSTAELLFHKALHSEALVIYPDEQEGTSSKKRPVHQYKCPICDKLYPRASLKCHIQIHLNERPYTCKVCNAGFVWKNNWLQHMRNHKEGKHKKRKNVEQEDGTSFLCSTCGASFKRKFILQQHMIIHTGKQCKCPKVGCFYTARSMAELNVHFKTHSDAKSYSCLICDYKGKTKQQLQRHQTIHSETRKYQCPLCSFTARLSGQFKRHMRVHTGAKPYACPHCSYRCNSLENLRKHVLSTNKHPGKCIYECKFCQEEDVQVFHTNFAKDFRAHLIEKHSDTFQSGAAAASYVAGIYEVQHDATVVCEDGDRDAGDGEAHEDQPTAESSTLQESGGDATSSKVASSYSVVVSKPENRNRQEELFPMYVIAKDEIVDLEDADSWNMVGSYDVESLVLVPFQNDEEALFEQHFE